MLSAENVGTLMRAGIATAEAGQMRFFARATAQTDPIFFDPAAARDAGYRAIVAPPTFVYALQQMSGCDPFELFGRLGVPLEKTLHGEQHFEYGVPICAADTISFSGLVTDIFSRKAGALDFLVYESCATNQFGEQVARIRSTTIIDNG